MAVTLMSLMTMLVTKQRRCCYHTPVIGVTPRHGVVGDAITSRRNVGGYDITDIIDGAIRGERLVTLLMLNYRLALLTKKWRDHVATKKITRRVSERPEYASHAIALPASLFVAC